VVWSGENLRKIEGGSVSVFLKEVTGKQRYYSIVSNLYMIG
jgi:hypothetical protein